jgi:hypothetical protein
MAGEKAIASPSPAGGIMHLTYRTETPHSETPSVSAEGVGAPEIDITPEMIDAGVAELCASNEDFEDRRDIIRRIFEAMSYAKP